jgi:hypothetical protein
MKKRGDMDRRHLANSVDPASESILRAQSEVLFKLGAELHSSQRAAIAAVQAEMDKTTQELRERMTSWRRQTIGIISLSTGLLVPCIVFLALLAVATLALGAKARDAWSDYRAAEAAVEGIRVHGALTVVKDGRLYVRIDPDSVAQGKLGNWYARVVKVELRESGQPAER